MAATLTRAGFHVRERTAPPPDPPRQGRFYSPEYLIAELRLWAEHHDGETPRVSDWNRCHARKHGTAFEEGWPSTQAVEDAFGSWRAGIIAAGLQPRRPGLPTLYESPLCANCGRGKNGRHGARCSTCASYWGQHGVEWTSEAAHAGRHAQGARNAAAFADRVEDFVRLRSDGRTNREIAALRGVSPQVVANAFSRAKARGWPVPRPPYWERGA